LILNLVVVFVLNIETIPHWEKQNLPKIRLLYWLTVVRFSEPKSILKSYETAVLSSFEKGAVANVGLKTQDFKNKG